MKRVAEGKVTSQFQITIKEAARKILNVNPGDWLVFYEDGEGSLIVKKGELVEARTGCTSS